MYHIIWSLQHYSKRNRGPHTCLPAFSFKIVQNASTRIVFLASGTSVHEKDTPSCNFFSRSLEPLRPGFTIAPKHATRTPRMILSYITQYLFRMSACMCDRNPFLLSLCREPANKSGLLSPTHMAVPRPPLSCSNSPSPSPTIVPRRYSYLTNLKKCGSNVWM